LKRLGLALRWDDGKELTLAQSLIPRPPVALGVLPTSILGIERRCPVYAVLGFSQIGRGFEGSDAVVVLSSPQH
jgi:hypothetical protein